MSISKSMTGSPFQVESKFRKEAIEQSTTIDRVLLDQQSVSDYRERCKECIFSKLLEGKKIYCTYKKRKKIVYMTEALDCPYFFSNKSGIKRGTVNRILDIKRKLGVYTHSIRERNKKIESLKNQIAELKTANKAEIERYKNLKEEMQRLLE